MAGHIISLVFKETEFPGSKQLAQLTVPAKPEVWTHSCLNPKAMLSLSLSATQPLILLVFGALLTIGS